MSHSHYNVIDFVCASMHGSINHSRWLCHYTLNELPSFASIRVYGWSNRVGLIRQIALNYYDSRMNK